VLDRQHAEAHRVAGNGPAGLGLPPVIDHRHVELVFRPDHRVGVGARRDGQQSRRIGRRAVLAPEIHLIAGRQQGGPVRFVRRSIDRMARQIVGVAGRVDAGKNGRMGLPGARIRLRDPRPCGADVEIIAARLLDQAVEFRAAETPVPVPGRPSGLIGRQRLFKRRGHRDGGWFRRLQRTPRTDPGDEN